MSGEAADLVAHVDQALIVVTTAADDQRSGCLVGFHGQCSIEPFHYAVWLSKANLTYRVALIATHLAVHFLAAGDDQLAELFGTESGDDVDKFSRCRWSVGEGDVPTLDGCAAIVLEKVSMFDEGGDHVCFVGSPVTVTSSEAFTPLRLSATEHLEPGHDADELTAEQVEGLEADEEDDR